VVWMNESLKRMLQLPYLKTIQSLVKRDENLYHDIISLTPGESKVATAHLDREAFKVLISATAFQTEGKKFKLIAFQNVNEALDETESKAWQKLLSVMTHEIMNSIAPISSLAETLKHRLQQSYAVLNNDSGSLDDLELGIDTIKKRSEGLLKFAQTYRNLNKINTLSLKKVHISDVFENLYQLMQPTLQQKNIALEIVLKDTDLTLEMDPNLVEQVMINLIVNAMEAVKDRSQPRIVLTAYLATTKKIIIKVADNGSGISEEVLDKIFIPFFSTKKSGSGIGLSLCKQIMMLHKGNITVQSMEGQGTAFLLQF
jgi:two-component system, NtrC family, nitrogen regulation sensor histidine kinase NtrY